MWDWIVTNKEWVFSGIGVTGIVSFLAFFKKKSDKKQSQVSGSNSTNLQVGGDATVNITNGGEKQKNVK